MVAKSFEVGDLVWAKMKGFSFWPGKVVDPPKQPTKVKKSQHCIYFYGSKNYAWIADEHILLHSDKVVASYGQKYKSSTFKEAVDEIIEESKNSSKHQKSYDEDFENHKEENEISDEKLESFEKHTSKDASPKSPIVSKAKPKLSTKKEIKKKKKHTLSFEHAESKKKRSHSFEQVESKRKCILPFNRTEPKSSYSLPDMEPYLNLLANVPPNLDYNGETVPSSLGLGSSKYVERPNTPPLDLDNKNDNLKYRGIIATTKKIGFLGLGKLGQGIVKNLLHSGHSVTVWSRTPEKCDLFTSIGAEKAQTPADVVTASDITFCCVSDTDVAKNLVFGNCGVLKGLDSCNGENKGYIEMTSMDPKTSLAIADEVGRKGGRYLEAPLNGSRLQAIEGTLFILSAGDKSLFDECESCFRAISSDTLYLGSKVGTATKFNIVHSMLLGTVYAALAESLALIKQTGLDEKEFLNTLQHSALDKKSISEKGWAMVENEYTCNTPLKNVQRDLNLGLVLGASCEQPLPIFAATNEAYKHLKLLRYEEHDVSAIYEGTKR